ncbi:hypothetical protein ENSA7_82410 [Enhygromyxa salina]|uniref:Uncharacterized protein n=1 Tax=Enhygromyxa salina TaxID=215803 RepID=A0A2S9XDI8_9BACT|nr:hypothetical protein ENSA7_82410 [Enhygromyxa salina]
MVLQRIQGDFFRLAPLDSQAKAETDDTAKEEPNDER